MNVATLTRRADALAARMLPPAAVLSPLDVAHRAGFRGLDPWQADFLEDRGNALL